MFGGVCLTRRRGTSSHLIGSLNRGKKGSRLIALTLAQSSIETHTIALRFRNFALF